MAELQLVGCCLASPHRSALRMVKEREGLKAAESEIHGLVLGTCCFWELAAFSFLLVLPSLGCLSPVSRQLSDPLQSRAPAALEVL